MRLNARSILWLGLDRFLNKPWKRWTARLVFWLLFALVVFPFFLSRVITQPPDVTWSRSLPSDYNLKYEPFTVSSFDGVLISGWWIPDSEYRISNMEYRNRTPSSGIQNSGKPVIIFIHGLGDSKAGALVNADFARQRGYCSCLIDLRNHGESGRRYVTLGAHESQDVKAAMRWLRQNKGVKSFVLWGVSLGAASSLLAAVGEPDVDGIIVEACYESMRQTVERHRRLYYPWIPRNPFVPLTLLWFQIRTGVDPDDVDLVKAVSKLERGKLFIIAGENDVRAPVGVDELLFKAAKIPRQMWVMRGIDHDHLGGDVDYERKIEKFLAELTPDKQRGIEGRSKRHRGKDEKAKEITD